MLFEVFNDKITSIQIQRIIDNGDISLIKTLQKSRLQNAQTFPAVMCVNSTKIICGEMIKIGNQCKCCGTKNSCFTAVCLFHSIQCSATDLFFYPQLDSDITRGIYLHLGLNIVLDTQKHAT